MSTEAQVSIRFSTKDTEVVKRALKELGDEGQKALAKMEAAARKPSEGLRAINAAAEEGQTIIRGYAERLGPFGAVLSSINPAALAAAASIAGIGIAVKSSFAAIAAEAPKVGVIADVAAKVGLSIERLQEYRFAANQAGVSSETFDRALETLARRQGEAIQGQGELVEVSRRYGIALVDATGKTRDTEAVFRDLAATSAGLTSQQERLALAQAALGRESGNMTNLLREGTEGLDAQARAAQNLGVVLSGSTVRGAKALADELERIARVRAVAYQQALLGDNPAQFIEAQQTLGEFATMWETAIGRIQRAVAIFTAFIFKHAEGDYPTLKAGAEQAQVAIDDLSKIIDEATAATGRAGVGTAELRKQYDDLIASVSKSDRIEQTRTEKLNKLWELLTATVITVEDFEQAQRLVNAAAEADIALMDKRAEKTKTYNERLTEQVVNTNLLIMAYRRSEYEGRTAAKTQDLLAQGFKGSAEEARRMAEVLLAQEDALAGVKGQWETLAAAAPTLAKETFDTPVTRAVENAVDGIKDSFDDLWFGVFRRGRLEADDFLEGLLDAFARTLAEMATLAIAKPILVPLISGVGSAMGLSTGQINQIGQQFGVGDAASLASFAKGGFNFGALNSSIVPNFATSGWGQSLGLSTAAGTGPGGMIYGGSIGGYSPALAGPQLTAMGKTFNVMSSTAGLFGGALGSMLPGLLGFTPRKGPGDEIGALAGTVGGSYLATTALLSAIPGVNFFAPFLGAALGKTLGGLFGAKPSSQQEVGTLWLGSGQRDFNDLGPGKNNTEFENNIRGFLDTISGLKDAFEKSTGGRVTTGYVTLSQDKRDGTQVIIDGQRSSVANTEDAVRAVLRAFVAGVEGIEPDLKAALDKIDFSGDLQQAANDLDFVVAFKPTLEALKTGALSIAESVKQSAGEQVRQITAQIVSFKDETARLGLDTNAAADATKKYVENLLGLGEALAPKSAAAQGLEAFTGMIEAVGPLLQEVALAVTPEQLLGNYRAGQGAALADVFRRRRNAATGFGAINDLRDLAGDITANRGDAALFGTSTTDLQAAFLAEIDGILADAISGAGSLTQARDVLNAIKEQFADYPEIVGAATEQLANLGTTLGSVSDTVTDLLQREADIKSAALEEQIDGAKNLRDLMARANQSITTALRRFETDSSLSMLTPMAQFDANQSYFFNDLAKRALLGDTDALDELAETGTALAEMAKQMFGSTSQTVNIQQRVKAVLEQARDLTARQTNVAQLTLDTATSQLNELKRIGDILAGKSGPGVGGSGGGGYTTAALDNLIGRYNSADPVIGSAAYNTFVSGANTIYGGLSDTNRLQSDLSFFQSNLGGAHGGAYQGYVDTITSRLRALGVPGYAAGGDHAGGIRAVGEDGIEIENTGPARYFSAGQTRNILSSAMADAQGLTATMQGVAAATMGGAIEAGRTADQVTYLRKDINRLNRTLQTFVDRMAVKALKAG